MSETTSTAEQESLVREKEQAAYKKTCDKYVTSGLSRNVTIQFLLEQLEKMGCKPPTGFIRCVDCGSKKAGAGFGVIEETTTTTSISENQRQDKHDKERMSLPKCHANLQNVKDQQLLQSQNNNDGKSILKLKPEIFLCQQHLRNESHAHESMVHELIHAIDMCRTKMDPLHNCIHLACTEIRAENLSGECSIWNEIGRMKGKFPKHGQTCVKRRAALSLHANHNCCEHAEKYIEAAFERCYKDTFPFDRHPNLR
jgi:Peptidase M76 family